MSVKRDTKRGTWYFVTRVTVADGTRQQLKRRGFLTKKAAAAEQGLVLAGQARGTFVRASRTALKPYLLDEWLPAKLSTLKPSTAASYEQMITAYVVPRIGHVELGKVDGAMLNALYADLLANGRTGASGRPGGLSAKSVRNVHGLLHRAFRDALRWRRLAVNPCDAADQPRKNTPEMRAWNAAELGRFVDGVADQREGAVWRLLATTGMRRGELLGLRWADVDLAASRLRVRQTSTMVGNRPETGTPKSAAGVRPVALDAATVAALKAWKAAQAAEHLLMGQGWQDTDDRVVTEPDGTPVHPQVLSRRFGAVVKRLGLPTIRLHDVRHSYATAALAAGVPVKTLSQRIGHADVGVTLRVYAHVLPGDDEAAADLVAALIARNSVTTV